MMLPLLLTVALACIQGSQASNQIRALNGMICLNVWNANMSPGGSINTWDCDGSANNQFEFLFPVDSATGGQIKATQSGLCLNILNGDKNNGAKVITYGCNNYPNSQWRWITVGGFKQIQSVFSGKCLNVYNAGTARGTPIIMWDCGDYPNNRMEIIGSGNGDVVPPPPPPPPPAGDCPFRGTDSTQAYSIMDETDVSPGRNIAIRASSSFEKCGQGCLSCDGCVAFVYNSAEGKCYLKDNKNVVESLNPNLKAGIFV